MSAKLIGLIIAVVIRTVFIVIQIFHRRAPCRKTFSRVSIVIKYAYLLILFDFCF